MLSRCEDSFPKTKGKNTIIDDEWWRQDAAQQGGLKKHQWSLMLSKWWTKLMNMSVISLHNNWKVKTQEQQKNKVMVRKLKEDKNKIMNRLKTQHKTNEPIELNKEHKLPKRNEE